MSKQYLAKVKLRENFSVSGSQAIRREGLNKQDKESLIENIVKYSQGNSDMKKLFENKDVASLAIGRNKWSFPIGRRDHINLNFRNYSTPLWENVINNQRQIWEGCVGLADHPEGDKDPSFKDSAVVWSNLRFDEHADSNLIWADAVFVGNHGRLAEDILESGGRVGFSSAGLGDLELMRENVNGKFTEYYNVVPSEFILERTADIVPNPSQDVYGISDMKVAEAIGLEGEVAVKLKPKFEPEEGDRVKNTHQRTSQMFGEPSDNTNVLNEPFEEVNSPLRENEGGGGVGMSSGLEGDIEGEDFYDEAPENILNINTHPNKRNRTMENKPNLSTFELRRAVEDIKTFMERTEKLEDPKERLKEYSEILTYAKEIKHKELISEVAAKKAETVEIIESMLGKGAEFTKIFGTDLSAEDVKQAVTDLTESAQNLEGATCDWKEVSLKLSKQLKKFVEAVKILKDRPTIKTHENLIKRSRAIKENMRTAMAHKEKEHACQLSAAKKDLLKVTDALKSYIKENKRREKKFLTEISSLKKKNQRLLEQAKTLKESAQNTTASIMDDNVKYLFEGAKGVSKNKSEYMQNNSRLTETANRGRTYLQKQEVKEYYDALLRKHGTSILPYSKRILECKSYKEAVNTFMEIQESKTPRLAETDLDFDNPIIFDMYHGE